jgi:hypothetical protein
MPLRFLIVLCTVTVGVGAIIYEHREQILEYTEGPRQQLADFLHKVADGMSPSERQRKQQNGEQEQAPLAGRPFSSSPSGAHSEKTEPQLDEKTIDDTTSAAATGKHSEQGGCLRFRGGGAAIEEEKQPAPLPLDFTSKSVGPENTTDTIESTIASRRSSSATYTSTPALPADPLHSQMQSFHTVDRPPPPPSNSSSATAITEAMPPPLPPTFEAAPPYWSIHEWANNTSHTTGENADAIAMSPPPSMTGSSMSDDLDRLSDVGSEVESVNSWTDVASEMST